ncbi:MAG TPA: MFS transporter [Chloroflexia bacterium]|nr:MFS transporter [Chloroflexia bacterium]
MPELPAPGAPPPAPVNDRREIWGWIWYDWANSVFSTTVYTTLLGPYLTALAQDAVGENGVVLSVLGFQVTAKSLYPLAISASVLLQVFLLPLLGAIADYTNLKKRLMILFCYLGVSATCLLFLITGSLYLWGALLFILANFCFGASIVLYNAYLAEITTEDQRDSVSSRGFAWGYMGGGILLALNLGLYQGGSALGIAPALAVRLSLLSAGLWWGGFALVTFRRLRTRTAPRALPAGQNLVTVGFRQLAQTFRELRRLPHTARYLVAFLLYNDGIQTVIGVSSIFLSQELFVARGLPVDNSFLIELILVIQFVAFGGSFLFAWIAARVGTKRAILISLVIWSGVIIYAYAALHTIAEAWGLGVVIALVLGGSQALSRSLFSCMIPISREAAFFGIYEIADEGTSWIGPLVFGLVVGATNSYREAILSIIVLMIIGAAILVVTNTRQAIADAGNTPPAPPVAVGEPA